MGKGREDGWLRRLLLHVGAALRRMGSRVVGHVVTVGG